VQRSFVPRGRVLVVEAFLVSLFLFVGSLGSFAGASHGPSTLTITVNSTADTTDANPGDGICATAAEGSTCTLRAAIMEANAHDGADTISVPAETYTLSLTGGESASAGDAAVGDLDITDSVTITGAAIDTTFIEAGTEAYSGIDRVFELWGSDNSTSMSALTVRNGNASSESNDHANGGGIRNNGATLALDDVEVSDSEADCRAGGIINWNGGTLTLTDSVVADNRSVDGCGNGGGLVTEGDASTTTITGSVITGNTATVGGGLRHASGTADVTESVISDNAAENGGGIYTTGGEMTLTDVVLDFNEVTGQASGGAIYHDGSTLTIKDSTIDNNTSERETCCATGAIRAGNGTLTMTGSTVSNNSAMSDSSEGGGLWLCCGTHTITNSTITGNSAVFGGGVRSQVGATFTNVTIADNTATDDSAGDNVHVPSGHPAPTFLNSIISGGEDGDCNGAVGSSGFNISSDDTCFSAGEGSTDQPETAPLVGALADNGGPTHTMALNDSSPAIDAGSPDTCPATDQRGTDRPLDGPDADETATCDIGAYEWDPSTDTDPDTDGDGVSDDADECDDAAEDADGVKDGDGCPETDADGDDILDADDNCPEHDNADQTDSDEDGTGDACEDSDEDGVVDDEDNCVDEPNEDQADQDENGVGDACQDTDGDTVIDIEDNCVDEDNEDQTDSDDDGQGDACDMGESIEFGNHDLIGGGPGGTEWDMTNGSSGCATSSGVAVSDGETDPDDETDMGSQSDAFDGGLVLEVDGSTFQDSDSTAELAGQTLMTQDSFGGLEVIREDTAMTSSPTLRTLTTFDNVSSEDISATVVWSSNLGSDDDEEVRGSSDGNSSYDLSDGWVVSDDDTSDNDPALTFVLFGGGAPQVTTDSIVDGDTFGTGCFSVDFEITIPAESSRSLMFFTEMNQTTADALNAGPSFDSIEATSDLLGGLSSADLLGILNWSFDSDGDGEPDSTDPDDDNDGVNDDSDNCHYRPNADQGDSDDDGIGNACEDTDGDHIFDVDDNCPAAANVDQDDTDSDGLGDACDPDIDADDIANDEDNCAGVPNPDQADTDGDDLGDACDDDWDNDEIPDYVDPCLDDASNECPQTEDDDLEVYRLSGGHQGTLNVLLNDNDSYGDGLTLTDFSDGLHGSVDCSNAGVCTYTADDDFAAGSDGFRYTMEDGEGTARTGIVHVEVLDAVPCADEEGACIDNSLVMLGVHPEGHLNVDGGPDSTWYGTNVVGLRYLLTGGDSTSPGCTCEGWGAADSISGVTGYANDSSGINNVTAEAFHATASDALSTANVGSTLEVTHDYHPSPDTPNLYEATVTMRNISDEPVDALYSRAMDWDIEPTAFNEFSTIFGGSSESLLHSSANGFSNANPLRDYAANDSGYAVGEFTDAGPTDHGAVFDFGFGMLDPGEEVSFNVYYGAAGTESEAIDALIAVGAEVFSLGQPNTPGGPTLGTPNTYIFAFSGVEGEGLSDRPFAVTDEIVTDEEGVGSVNVLANDTDFPYDDISLVSWRDGALGTVECDDAGNCTYTGGDSYYSSDLFRYVIEDDEGNTDTGAVRVSAPDTDGDEVPDPSDNCVDEANEDQADSDEDGLGNVCDANTDSDVDGIDDFNAEAGEDDNCDFVWNPDQADSNLDNQGDACEPDEDVDGVADDPDESMSGEGEGPNGDEDNCIGTFNPYEEAEDGTLYQPDGDEDGVGDACDDSDGDGTIDSNDPCPDDPEDQCKAAWVDSDWDGALAPSDAAPMVKISVAQAEGMDSCPNAWNGDLTSSWQIADKDNDGIANACDPVEDLCPATILPNATFENAGFETGDLSGWSKGIQTEGVAVSSGGGGFTTPYEGGWMARLGSAHGSHSEPQPIGPNALCQAFTIPEGTDPADLQRFFAFNVFTYDYKGYDSLRFEATLLNSDGPNEILASVVSDAWGSGTALKSTGWQVIELNLEDADRGKTVLLSFTAGGTYDTLYGTWAYIDSASGPEPSLSEVESEDIETETGTVTENPLTGDATLLMPYGSKSDVTVPFEIDCPEGTSLVTDPAPFVQLMNGGGAIATYELTHVDGAMWELFIDSTELANGDLVLFATCAGGDEEPISLQDTVMSIVLYDPSGIVSDSVTGQPIVGATVTLYNVPGWTAAQSPAEEGLANKCQSNLSKEGGEGSEPWSQPAPTELGVVANPFNGTIDPATTTQSTTSIGYYGWNVAAGCWYVTVSADGYQSLTSPVVGVPTEVLDLDLQLTPTGGGTGGTGGTGGGGGGGGGTSPQPDEPKEEPEEPEEPNQPDDPNEPDEPTLPECASDSTAVCGSDNDDQMTIDGDGQTVYAGDGDDEVTVTGCDNTVYTQKGNDSVTVADCNNTVITGSGYDEASVAGNGANSNRFVTKVLLRGIEQPAVVFSGGKGKDILTGGAGADAMYGGGGRDRLVGLGGSDTLNGGASNDTAKGGAGNDTLRGGAGSDALTGGRGADKLFGGNGKDKCVARRGDTVRSC